MLSRITTQLANSRTAGLLFSVGLLLVAAGPNSAAAAQDKAKTKSDRHSKPPANGKMGKSGGYHVLKTVPLGGEGGWDYLTVDNDARRLYISRGTHTMVLDADSLSVVGYIPDTLGVQRIAIVPESAQATQTTAARLTSPFSIPKH